MHPEGGLSMCLLDSDKDFVVSLWPWRAGTRQGNSMSSISACGFLHMNAGAPGGQKRELDHLELQSQTVVYGLV